jgi:hypothetical protein
MNSLFTCSSTFPREKKEELVYYWYRPDREASILPYEQLITRYSALIPEVRLEVEKKCRELLTLDELEKLRIYLLRTKGLEVVSKEVFLPLDAELLFKPRPKEIFELWKEDGYSLPFRIEGHVQREPIPAPEEIDTGVQD